MSIITVFPGLYVFFIINSCQGTKYSPSGFDIRSKYDGFLISNNVSNPYLLMRTQAGLHFLLDGPKNSCYHPRAYLLPTRMREHYYGIDSARNALLAYTSENFLWNLKLEPGRYGTLIGELINQAMVVGPVSWPIAFMQYSDKFVGFFLLFTNGWLMYWDHMTDALDTQNSGPQTYTPVTHSESYRNATAFHVTACTGKNDLAIIVRATQQKTIIEYVDIQNSGASNFLEFPGKFCALDSNQDGDVFVVLQSSIRTKIIWLQIKTKGGYQVLEQKSNELRLPKMTFFSSLAVTNSLIVTAYYPLPGRSLAIVVYHKDSNWTVYQNITCNHLNYNVDERLDPRQFMFTLEEIFIVDPHRRYNYEKPKWAKKMKRREQRNFDFASPNEVKIEVSIKVLAMFGIVLFILLSIVLNPISRTLT